ncbi:hypothetical protein HDU79_005699 [Rhizoclosmatium sp. JEL0117]|nr:hypothetical protein HDU79_005699 [Rhizoclosmatium sp. JEL0117]
MPKCIFSQCVKEYANLFHKLELPSPSLFLDSQQIRPWQPPNGWNHGNIDAEKEAAKTKHFADIEAQWARWERGESSDIDENCDENNVDDEDDEDNKDNEDDEDDDDEEDEEDEEDRR